MPMTMDQLAPMVQAVKLEGGRRVLPQVRALTAAGIPVMGHLGLTPQSINTLGGVRRVQGRGPAGADRQHRRRAVLRRADPGLAGYGLHDTLLDAARRYADDVTAARYPDLAHSYQ